MEDAMVRELLLVCTGMGSSEVVEVMRDGQVHQQERFVRGDFCEHWLGDLQRALRRDDEHRRDIAIVLSSWKVTQTKLIPLFLQCRDDSSLTMTLAKIFLMLTMPLSGNATEALAVQVNPKLAETVQKEQAEKRANADQQLHSLCAAKRAFISREVLSVLVGMLEEPLSRVGLTRSETDTEAIEVVLTLLRNILSIPDPTAAATALSCSSATSSARDVLMHEELVTLMQEELLLDVLLLLAQDISARENSKLNLLLMEIFHAIIANQDPSALLKARKAQQSGVVLIPTKGQLKGILSRERDSRSTAQACLQSRHSRFGGLLRKADSLGGGGSRGSSHSRFIANPFKNPFDCVPQAERKRKAVRAGRGASGPASAATCASLTAVAGAAGSAADAARARTTAMASSGSLVAVKARTALHAFSQQFLSTSFDPFIRSVKNEFRVDSSRLQAHDKPVFFHLVSFFVSFHRQHQLDLMRTTSSTSTSTSTSTSSSRKHHHDKNVEKNNNHSDDIDMEGHKNSNRPHLPQDRAPVATAVAAAPPVTFEVGPILETMDLFSFNLVLNECQSAMVEKAYGRLEEAVRLLKESTHVLSILAASPQSAHQLLALGLLGKLFYAKEPIDRLHELMRYWQPGRFSKRFLGDLIELTHITLKVLELYVKRRGAGSGDDGDDGISPNVTGTAGAAGSVRDKEMEERVEEAQEFNLNGYFRRLATNHTVSMYTSALEDFQTNGAKLNHYILAFFIRILSFQPAKRSRHRSADMDNNDNEGDHGYVELDDDGESIGGMGRAGGEGSNDAFTLEPMLFHVTTFTVFHQILTDPVAAKSSEFKHLIRFIHDVIRHFGTLASKNNLLYVEALFRHPMPHPTCRRISEVYATKDDLFYYECLAAQRSGGGDNSDDDDGNSRADVVAEARGRGVGIGKDKGSSSRGRVGGDGGGGRSGSGNSINVREGKDEDALGATSNGKEGSDDENGRQIYTRRSSKRKAAAALDDDDDDEDKDDGDDEDNDDAKTQGKEKENAVKGNDEDDNVDAIDHEDDGGVGRNGSRDGQGSSSSPLGTLPLSSTHKEARKEKEKDHETSDSDESGDEWNVDLQTIAAEAAKNREASGQAGKKKDKKRKAPAAARGGGPPKQRTPKWTKEEDEVLQAKYPLYADTSSVFHLLIQDDVLEKKGRNVDQVTRRLRHLGLLKKGAPVSADDTAITTTPLLSAAGSNSDSEESSSSSESEDNSSSDSSDPEDDEFSSPSTTVNKKKMKSNNKALINKKEKKKQQQQKEKLEEEEKKKSKKQHEEQLEKDKGKEMKKEEEATSRKRASSIDGDVSETATATANDGNNGSNRGGMKTKKRKLLLKKTGGGVGGGRVECSSSEAGSSRFRDDDDDDDDLFADE